MAGYTYHTAQKPAPEEGTVTASATTTMTAVENAMRVIRFDSPEWIPVGLPIYGVHFGTPNLREEDSSGRHVDMWGVTRWREHDGPGGSAFEGSIKTPADLATFSWPDPDDERICGPIYEQAEKFPGGDLWMSGGHGCLIWELAYPMVGMENLLMYFLAEPNFVKDLFEGLSEFHLGIARHYARAGVTSTGFSDDLATQAGPFFSEEVLEEFFKPAYRKVYGFYNERNIIVGQHCDGNVLPLIPYFKDVGLNILNPLQITANDIVAVREATQGTIAIHGAVSNVLVTEGPVERIRNEVHRMMWTLGREGGYIPAIDHSMPASDEHKEAVWDAVREFGRYPIDEPVCQ